MVWLALFVGSSEGSACEKPLCIAVQDGVAILVADACEQHTAQGVGSVEPRQVVPKEDLARASARYQWRRSCRSVEDVHVCTTATSIQGLLGQTASSALPAEVHTGRWYGSLSRK